MFLITILLFAQPLSDELTREDASVVDAAKEAELWVAEGRGTVASIPFKRGNRWGYLDREGRVVIEPQYQRAGSFRYGRAVADRTIINPDGSLALRLPHYVAALHLCEDCFWYSIRGDGLGEKWGLMDYKGAPLIEEKYSDVRPFSGGLAAVNQGAEWQFPGVLEGGCWGYVNREGKEIVALKYYRAGDFHEGRAVVESISPGNKSESLPNTDTLVIDAAGRVVFPVYGSHRGAYSNGLLSVLSDGSTSYFDRDGQIKCTVQGDGAMFSERLAVVTFSNAPSKSGAIDASGQNLFEIRGEIGDFHSGRASFKFGETESGYIRSMGFIDADGKLVIPTVYNEVNNFDDGVAIVHKAGNFYWINDHRGQWTNGIWLLIDKSGRELAAVELDPKQLLPAEPSPEPTRKSSNPTVDD